MQRKQDFALLNIDKQLTIRRPQIFISYFKLSWKLIPTNIKKWGMRKKVSTCTCYNVMQTSTSIFQAIKLITRVGIDNVSIICIRRRVYSGFVHLTENHFFNPHKPYGLNSCRRWNTVLDRKLYRWRHLINSSDILIAWRKFITISHANKVKSWWLQAALALKEKIKVESQQLFLAKKNWHPRGGRKKNKKKQMHTTVHRWPL